MGEFGDRLKQLRTEKGLSQAMLAKLAKVGQAALSKIEAGKNEPSYAMAKALANALGHNISIFDDFSPRPTKKKKLK